MVPATSSFRDAGAAFQMESESTLHVVPVRRKHGVRTYALMVLGMAVVTIIVTCLCVIIIRYRWHSQVTDELSQDLEHSVITFQELQAERLGALDRENSLLAELPTLKALMTSGDDLTIQDGAVEFWQLSGTDLFALADPGGRIAAVYSKTATTGPALREGLRKLLGSTGKHYLIDGSSLYACSLRPLYFGSNQEGTLLGYVISGVSIESTARQINDPTAVEATFLSAGKIAATTLSPSAQIGLEAQAALLAKISRKPATVKLGDVRFLAVTEDLSTSASAPLQLLVLKSLDPAERSITRINRMVLSAGLLALLCGAVLMVTVSRLVTRPLEELSNSVRAFGTGDVDHRLPRHGTLEVLELSAAFAKMRKENQHANRALLESERLATIGRMASSVSHDFRHYLATIYANSEFLLRDKISSKERADIFADISTAVLGSADMIESLLMFSRTGASKRKTAELMVTLLDRAVALVRAHPDGDGVRLETRFGDPADTGVIADGKQVERAIFNLLLNACQAAHCAANGPQVLVTLEVRARHLTINVIDNGVGVPEIVRKNLFEPFVSEGKQKGTGLGLTLAHCIASEHGGEVSLVSSRGGETIFQMKIARDLRSHHVVLDSGLGERGEGART
jgi:signal transduction histidine kinase